MSNLFDRVLFSNTGNSFLFSMTDVIGYLETTTDGCADGNRLTLVTQAIHVSRIMPMRTLVKNPNRAGALDAGEGIKEPESGLIHQEAHAQRKAAILSKYKRRRRNLRGKCRYGLNLFVFSPRLNFDHSLSFEKGHFLR